MSFRVRDPEGGPGERRHVPRLRAGDPLRSSPVTTFLGGACAVRRAAFDAAGGLPEDFFYAHEETDLAWQALNAGYRIVYDARCVMFHPAVAPTRHAMFYRLNARNRVWLARRNLPWPVAFTYLAVWIAHDGGARAQAGVPAAVVRRLPRGLAQTGRPTPPDLLAHSLAHDPPGPPPRHLTAPEHGGTARPPRRRGQERLRSTAGRRAHPGLKGFSQEV